MTYNTNTEITEWKKHWESQGEKITEFRQQQQQPDRMSCQPTGSTARLCFWVTCANNCRRASGFDICGCTHISLLYDLIIQLYYGQGSNLYWQLFALIMSSLISVGLFQVPFGQVEAVSQWMQICEDVGSPSKQHAKRPVHGFDCKRSEVTKGYVVSEWL